MKAGKIINTKVVLTCQSSNFFTLIKVSPAHDTKLHQDVFHSTDNLCFYTGLFLFLRLIFTSSMTLISLDSIPLFNLCYALSELEPLHLGKLLICFVCQSSGDLSHLLKWTKNVPKTNKHTLKLFSSSHGH